MNVAFLTIWDQLVLITNSDIYCVPANFFDPLENQTLQAWTESKLTSRQYIVLINAIREWRDILGKSGGEEIDGEETESNLQISDPAE